MKPWRCVAGLLAVMVCTAGMSFGQERPRPAPQPASDGIEVMTGLMSFDLQGTGNAMPFAIRGTKSLIGGLALEVGATMVYPDLQFGSSSLMLPEARLTYSWLTGRLRPFVGGGAGVALQRAGAIDPQWRTSLTAGGGARFHLTERLYAIGEMRLRGMSDFSASTAEWLGGVGWRFR